MLEQSPSLPLGINALLAASWLQEKSKVVGVGKKKKYGMMCWPDLPPLPVLPGAAWCCRGVLAAGW